MRTIPSHFVGFESLGVRTEHSAGAASASGGSVIRSGYELVVDEQFDGDSLDYTQWIPFYLPHWSGSERAAASYRLAGDHLEIFIAEDQPIWLPEIAPNMRVSSLQTGLHSGGVGSAIGQHRTDPNLIVVEEQGTQRLITPHYGAIEIRASWNPTPSQMVALWMIGVEEAPDESAEICIFEIFGSDVEQREVLVGMGVHPFGDPAVVDDFEKVPVSLDLSAPHDFAVVWTEHDLCFFIDGEQRRHVEHRAIRCS